MLTEIPAWHLGFLNNICFKKSGAIPPTVQGNREFWKGWNSWLERKCGPGEQEYSEFPALAWIAIPWELEHSLAPWELLRRADSMDCWSWTHRKIKLFGVTLSWLHVLHSTPKRKEFLEENFAGLPQLPWSLSKTFPCFSNDCWTFVSHHIQFKTLE